MTSALPAEAFEHGDPRRYRRGCKCELCMAGVTADNRYRRYLRATGRGLLTSPTRAADHIERLRTAGMPDTEIMADALIGEDVLYRIVRQQGSIHRATEARVLAVRPRATDLPGSGHRISGLGTVRRLRALAADGWPAAQLASRCGKHKQFIVYLQNQGGEVAVRRWVDSYVRTLYSELAGAKPEEDGVAPHIAKRTRERAAAKGWRDSSWWEDYGRIDDPAFDPDAADRDLNFHERARLRREEIEHLAWCGHTPEQIVARLDGEIAISTARQIVQEWRTGEKRVRKQVATPQQEETAEAELEPAA